MPAVDNARELDDLSGVQLPQGESEAAEVEPEANVNEEAGMLPAVPLLPGAEAPGCRTRAPADLVVDVPGGRIKNTIPKVFLLPHVARQHMAFAC